MAETLSSVVPGLYVATRQGIVALEATDAEPNVLPFALNGVHVTALLADAKGVLLAAGTFDRGVLASGDGGRTWKEAAGFPPEPVLALARSDSTVLALTTAPALHRSVDGGASFQAVTRFAMATTGGVGPVVPTCLLQRDRLLIAGGRNGGIVLSMDGGCTFRDVTGDLPASVLCLAARGAEATLAGCAAGLWISERPGEAPWRPLWAPPERQAVTAVAASPARPETLLIGAARRLGLAKPALPEGADSALHRSDDGGRSWRPAPCGSLPVVRGVFSALVFSPGDPTRVFAGTTSGEVFESLDGGVTFALVAATLPGVLAFAAGPALVR